MSRAANVELEAGSTRKAFSGRGLPGEGTTRCRRRWRCACGCCEERVFCGRRPLRFPCGTEGSGRDKSVRRQIRSRDCLPGDSHDCDPWREHGPSGNSRRRELRRLWRGKRKRGNKSAVSLRTSFAGAEPAAELVDFERKADAIDAIKTGERETEAEREAKAAAR